MRFLLRPICWIRGHVTCWSRIHADPESSEMRVRCYRCGQAKRIWTEDQRRVEERLESF